MADFTLGQLVPVQEKIQPFDLTAQASEFARQRQANVQTAGLEQQQAMQQGANQRSAAARQVYAQQAQNGPINPDELYTRLLTVNPDEAAKYKEAQAEEAWKQRYGDYYGKMAQTKSRAEDLAELIKKAQVTGGAISPIQTMFSDEWKNPEKLTTDNPNTNRFLQMYSGLYDVLNAEGHADAIQTPGQAAQDPATAMRRLPSLLGEASTYHDRAQEVLGHDKLGWNKMTEASKITGNVAPEVLAMSVGQPVPPNVVAPNLAPGENPNFTPAQNTAARAHLENLQAAGIVGNIPSVLNTQSGLDASALTGVSPAVTPPANTMGITNDFINQISGQQNPNPAPASVPAPAATGGYPNMPAQITEQKRHNLALESKPSAQGLVTPKDDEKTALWLATHINALDVSSRKALGVAGAVNLRASRMQEILNKPTWTPEEKELVQQDLLWIAQGGVPHEFMTKQGLYASVAENMARVSEKVSSKPQSMDTPEIKNALRGMLNTMVAADNDVIEKNMGIYAAAAKGFIKRNPDQWANMTQAVTGSELNTSGIPQTSTSTPAPKFGGHKKGAPAALKATKRYNPTTGKIEDIATGK